MFVILLLVARVSSEWVEIAQHQHRKEPSRRPTFSYDESTEANKIYPNFSLTERAWHKNGLPKIPNIGSVKRVQLRVKQQDMFSVGVLSESALTKEKETENRGYDSVGSIRAPSMKIHENEDINKVNRKSNANSIGNKTNVQLQNPFRYFGIDSEKSFSVSPQVISTNTRKIEKKQKIGERDKVGQPIYTSLKVDHNVKHILSGSDVGMSKVVALGKHNHEHVQQHWKEDEKKVNNNVNGTITNMDTIDDVINKTFGKHPNTPPRVSHSSSPDGKQIITQNLNRDGDKQIRIDNATDSQQNSKDKSNNYNDPNLGERGDGNLRGSTKTNTVEMIWKLMKVVADNISRNTRRSFRSKVRYLEDLRNNIIVNIAERVEQAWPDDAGEVEKTEESVRGARLRRAARGHVEFPSSESALMTISFLTFAVFLIKLVLQVVHTYKNKTMMITPAVVAAVGRAAAAAAATSPTKQIHY